MAERGSPEEPRDGSAGGLTGDLVGARPGIDDAAMEDVRARAERALFGRVESPRVGRFVLLKPIAGGGMGMIHRAYDPQLERPVALKLLHPRLHGTPHARARLIAEARVLARLAHPNVVPVYEVLEVEDQIVIVMELVEGRTLAEWQREQRRGWREVVAVYGQAGRGLAAAHDLGIIHRDFKPANAIVGDDGRVRVLDFGLARFTKGPVSGDKSGEAPPFPQALPSSLTASGEILGTLAYMAPEQLAGRVATPASDQFSFCVSLHGALHGVPPFRGTDAASLLESISSGRITPGAGAQVPSWLRTLVGRGLAAAPEDRHPSMKAILDELGRERGWRRLRWATLAAIVSLTALGLMVIANRSRTDRLATCDGGVDEVGRVWNPTRGQQIRDALARVATPYARAIDTQVLDALDAYRDSWSKVHRVTCLEYRTAPMDVRLAAQFERKRQCLDRRLQDLAGAVEVLVEIDSASVTNAVDVAAHLPPVDMCAKIETLPEEVDLPTTVAARSQVATIREQLSRASALERAGRSADALALADRALTNAEQVAYPSALLEAELAKGTFLTFRYDFANAVAPLAKAEELAHEYHQYHSVVVAGARRIYAEGLVGMNGPNLDRLAGQVDELERLSRGLRTDHFARPLLLNYIGVLYMARGERARATEYFGAARTSLAGVENPDLELTAVDMNLAMVTVDRTQREQLARGAWKRYRDQLGPSHITTLAAQCLQLAHYVGDPEIALDLVRQANDQYRRFHPDQVGDRSLCVFYQAFLTMEVGDPARPEAAAALYGEVAALAKDTTDADILSRARLANGYLQLFQAKPKTARDHFAAVIDEYEHSPNWWDHQLAAEGHLGAGIAEESLGDVSTAIGHLERAAETLAGLIPRNEDVELRQRLALARMSLARVLRRQSPGAKNGRAAALEAQAKAFYREANPIAYGRRLAALGPEPP
jgi:tRNA A-37 threonylcarbamoyl transferase component Bud32/tetratricopeptide (TPR) repeat protein